MFLKSTCRGKSDSGVCMTSVLAKRMRLHSADLLFQNMFGRRIRWKSAQRSRILFASTAVMHTPDPAILYISILRTYTTFRKNQMLALSVCFPQPCSSNGQSLPRQDHVWTTTEQLVRFHTDEFDDMFVNWIPANLHVRSNQTHPYFNTQETVPDQRNMCSQN